MLNSILVESEIALLPVPARTIETMAAKLFIKIDLRSIYVPDSFEKLGPRLIGLI